MLQASIDVPNLTTVQCDEAMDVVPEDIWNLVCSGCRGPGHSLFTCPYLSTEQRIYVYYQYFHHHVEWNPLVAKWYM